MGIPKLTSTLEPYAVHGVLDNDPVVIDGPALAYHTLHICNKQGLSQPSYRALGNATVAWLDSLVRRGANVDAIYFDGHLPQAKRLVRMGRMVKSLNRIKTAHSKDPSGFFLDYFSTAASRFLPPSFHVPAVIDALRRCPRYANLVHLVPGEADAYCAKHLSESGGVVLTSDSDLLIHDIGNGRVVFLRDISFHGYSGLSCASFSPVHICERLKLSPTSEIRRLAYERKLSPYLTLPQLLQDCAQPVIDAAEYTEFCHEYLDHEIAPLPVSAAGAVVQTGLLDPRISELILQLGDQDAQADDPNGAMFFLPILLEDPSRGSAWEQSTPIRQLAYTVARWIIPGPSSTVQEYRRVHMNVQGDNTLQKGRPVKMLPREAAMVWARDLITLMSEATAESESNAVRAWQLLCLTLDIRHCHEEGKESHVLQILKQHSRKRRLNRISWDIIHFVAQLQAAYYSFRLLEQIVSLAPAEETMPELHGMLSSLPPLEDFPTLESTLGFLRKSGKAQTVGAISRLVPLPESSPEEELGTDVASKKLKAAKQHGRDNAVGSGTLTTHNVFDVLSSNA